MVIFHSDALCGTKPQMVTPKSYDDHPRHFAMSVTPPPPPGKKLAPSRLNIAAHFPSSELPRGSIKPGDLPLYMLFQHESESILFTSVPSYVYA